VRNRGGICRCCLGQAGLILFETSVFSDGTGSEDDRLLFFRDLGQRSLNIELLVAGERKGGELTRGREAVDDIAEARARGHRGEKDFGFLGGGCDSGLQIERDQDGERGGLRLRAADGELATVPRAEQLPVCAFLGVLCGNGHDPHGVPELGERAQYGGFRDFATKLGTQFAGGERAFALQQLPRLGGERRDPSVACGRRLALGVALRLKRVEIRQRLRGGEEVRMLAHEARNTDAGCGAEEIERDDRAGCDQPCEHLRSGGDLLWIRCGFRAAGNGFHKCGGRHRQMLLAGQIEAERRVGEPALRVVEREQRIAILTPTCLTCLF
jgi:hypothetical protein